MGGLLGMVAILVGMVVVVLVFVVGWARRTVRQLEDARRDYLQAIQLAQTTAAAQRDARQAYESSRAAWDVSRAALDEMVIHLGSHLRAHGGSSSSDGSGFDA